MSNVEASIGTNALVAMQAWARRDEGTLKKLFHRDCTIMVGTHPPQLLDRPSFIGAIQHGLTLQGFKPGEALINRHSKSVWWSSGMELDLKLGMRDWSGPFLITDLWRKATFGGWKIVERSIAPTAKDEDQQLAAHLRGLQLWR